MQQRINSYFTVQTCISRAPLPVAYLVEAGPAAGRTGPRGHGNLSSQLQAQLGHRQRADASAIAPRRGAPSVAGAGMSARHVEAQPAHVIVPAQPDLLAPGHAPQSFEVLDELAKTRLGGPEEATCGRSSFRKFT
jgi:hypothetical protein